MKETLVILNMQSSYEWRNLGRHTMRHSENAMNGYQRHQDKRNELLIKRMYHIDEIRQDILYLTCHEKALCRSVFAPC